jgi:hypothetical protein
MPATLMVKEVWDPITVVEDIEEEEGDKQLSLYFMLKKLYLYNIF